MTAPGHGETGAAMGDEQMTGARLGRRSLGGLFAALLLVQAAPAAAQDTDTQAARATQTYNDAVDAVQSRRYDAACRGFGNAAVMYENAIGSLMGQSMATEEDRDYIKRYANTWQGAADQAKKAAKAACYLRDNAAPSSESSGPSSGSSSSSSSWTSEDYRNSENEAIQDAARRAAADYKEADRLYDAKDFPGACAKARSSAAIFTYVVTQLRIKPELRSAFDNPNQILANAATAAQDRDGYFCKA